MKLLFSTLLVIFFICSFGQVPQGMNYQAVVRNTTGQIVPNSHVNFKFSILANSINGNVVYSETDSTTTDQFGLAILKIGTGIVQSGSFATIDWLQQDFLKVEFDPSGGNNFVVMGINQLMSVPYSLYSQQSGSSGNDASIKTLFYLSLK